MSYRIGNKDKIEIKGETLPLVCPKCGEKTEFTVFSNGKTDLIPKFPIIKNSSVYFLVCPKCSAAFGIKESLGKAFEKGEKLSVGNYDLTELEEFNV